MRIEPIAGTRMVSMFVMMLCTLLAVNAQAAPPNGKLQQMVQQLQANPADDVLREKIIKQAQQMKPAPMVPEEAIRHEGRGKFAFKNAKSNDDYLDAAKEYQQAIVEAPWVTGYYYDLCTIYERAGKYAEAKHQCEIYLHVIGNPEEITQIREKIAGLEYGIEKNSPEAQAKQRFKKDEDLVRSLDGTRYYCDSVTSTDADGNRYELQYIVSGGDLQIASITTFSQSYMQQLARYGQYPDNPQTSRGKSDRVAGEPRKFTLEARGLGWEKNPGMKYFEISEDGTRLRRWFKFDQPGKADEALDDCVRH